MSASIDSSNRIAIHPGCREFVRVTEALLARRRSEFGAGARHAVSWQYGGRSEPRTFSPTQLRDTVYSSYPAMLRGFIKTPPPRDTVLRLADYLQCDAMERDHLLLAAGYATKPLYFVGEELDARLAIVRQWAHSVSAPTVVVTRDWDIHDVNEAVFAFMGVTRDSLAALAPDRRNLMDLLIDPASPLNRMIQLGPTGMAAVLKLAVWTFRHDNAQCENEEWLLLRLKRWRALGLPPRAVFSAAWDDVARTSEALDLPARFAIPVVTSDGQRLTVRPFSTIMPNYAYPRAISFLPVAE